MNDPVELTAAAKLALLQQLLVQYNGISFMPRNMRKYARSLGYTETSQSGRAYVRGARANPEMLSLIESQLFQQGHAVRAIGWTMQSKQACVAAGVKWTTLDKFITDSYGCHGGGEPLLQGDIYPWLRQFAAEHAEYERKDYQAAIVLRYGVLLHIATVGKYLRRAGLSQQVLRRIATQRNTVANISYATRFMQHVQQFTRIAFFDESGINRKGMLNRRNKRYGIKGAGGAYLQELLRRWPHTNLSVLAFLDKDGAFCAEAYEGGTDAERVNLYFATHSALLAARGVDAIVIDNCSAHHIGSLLVALHIHAPNIAIVFLPRYWPQWNPIELVSFPFYLSV